MTRTRRWAPWLAMALVLVAALAVGARGDGPDVTAEDRARALAASVRCPTCAGQSALESDAAAAEGIRTEIRRRLAEGQSDEEIRDYLVGRYGEQILLTPPASGVGSLVWALPVAGVVVAAGALGAAFLRWRSRRPERVSDADRALVEAARAGRRDDGA